MPGQCQNVKEGGHVFARTRQPPTEALMNAGDNYNRPKVFWITLWSGKRLGRLWKDKQKIKKPFEKAAASLRNQ